MRTLVFFVSAALCLPAFAQEKLACQAKLDLLAKMGVNEKALIQAFKNVKSSNLSKDLVILAKVGHGKTKNNGELQVLDLRTGGVAFYPITHGIPFNSGAAEDQNLEKGQYTYFGGMQINFKESDTKAPRWRMSTMAVSPSLVNHLNAQSGGSEDEGGSLIGQHLLHCSKRFKRDPKKANENDLCLEPERFNEVKTLVSAEKTPVALFVYPGKKADAYFQNVKLDNDAPPTCEYLSRMPEPGTPFDAKPAAPAAVPYAPPGTKGKAR